MAVMFVLFAFAFFYLRIVITKPLAIAFTEDNVSIETSDPSLVPDDEVFPDGRLDDIALFAPSIGVVDSSIDLTDLSGVDASCPNDVSLGTDETISFEPSNSDDLVAKDVENERLSFLLARSSDQECADRNTKPEKPDSGAATLQVPLLWPLLYPKENRGQCSDPLRPIAVCCAGRNGISPFDCWACTRGIRHHLDPRLIGF
jgi:hypothetical protein